MPLFFYNCGVHYVVTLVIFPIYCYYALLLKDEDFFDEDF
jgi:hypothetical protein